MEREAQHIGLPLIPPYLKFYVHRLSFPAASTHRAAKDPDVTVKPLPLMILFWPTVVMPQGQRSDCLPRCRLLNTEGDEGANAFFAGNIR